MSLKHFVSYILLKVGHDWSVRIERFKNTFYLQKYQNYEFNLFFARHSYTEAMRKTNFSSVFDCIQLLNVFKGK